MNLLTIRTFNLLKKASTAKEWTKQLMNVNNFHSNCTALYNEQKSKNELVFHFRTVEKKEKETFLDVIRLYINNNQRVDSTTFIIQAMKFMDEFGVQKDLEVYKALMNVFPKGKYIAQNVFQVMMYHYPKQQDVALELLRKMEMNHVIPDYEMQNIILNIFGIRSYPIQKFWRMMYWMPKFAHINPWPVPKPTPKESQELAHYAVKKLSSADVQTKITHYKTKDVLDAIDDTWIVSSMSRAQQELLAVQPTDKSLFIEGPFIIWVADQCLDYFVLKGDPIKRDIVQDTSDYVSDMKIPFWEKLHNKIPITIHEQDDGVYYALCATGTSSKDSLLSWIRCLQETNPVLKTIPIIFKLKSLVKQPLYIENDEEKNDALYTQDKKMLKNTD